MRTYLAIFAALTLVGCNLFRETTPETSGNRADAGTNNGALADLGADQSSSLDTGSGQAGDMSSSPDASTDAGSTSPDADMAACVGETDAEICTALV